MPGLEPIGEISKRMKLENESPAPPSSMTTAPPFKCVICQDTGWVTEIKTGVGKAYPKSPYEFTNRCKCREKSDREERQKSKELALMKYCALPPGTEGWTFDKFRRRPGTEEGYRMAFALGQESSEVKWLVLAGHSDMGKSHLAVAVCRGWLGRERPARYVLVPDMLDQLRRGYDLEGEQNFYKQMDFFKSASLLVLDDLGVGTVSPWGIEKLTIIIDYRYTNGLPLMVTTNKDLADIPGDVDHRLGSRLQRAPLSHVVQMVGPEYRVWKSQAKA